MLNFEEIITKLQNFSDKFTTDLDLRDGENQHKPYESLDTFVDYDMIEAALHHLTTVKKLDCPIDAHIAMSLYQYNVRTGLRAQRIWNHFAGECAPMAHLMEVVDSKNWATEMALPTAKIYLAHALERYGAEATERRRINEVSL